MLRAVLSVNECERVVSQHPATYVGDQFPKLGSEQEAANDFAVLNIPRDETPAGWQPGDYRLDSELTQANEAPLALSRSIARVFFQCRSTVNRTSLGSYFPSP